MWVTIQPPLGPSYILVTSEGNNITREKYTYKLLYFLKFRLRNLMAISEDDKLKRGGITRVHCMSK